jgi:hypothetical protein
MFAQATEMINLSEPITETLYGRARGRGRRGQLWAKLTGRTRHLLALTEVENSGTVHRRCAAGARAVPIDRIRGSENRSTDFDVDFNPLGDHNKRRWLSVARAWQRGVALPPVELIQVDGVYFVRDGHHRISVARAMGQLHVEARVVVWH